MATDPPYLFVSYASTDRELVLPVVDRLEAAGVRAWVDREGIHGGANYALEIAEAIEHAAALLLFCSAASLASRNVKQELALAWRFERPYLPLLLDPVEIPKDVAYWLEGSQWIELLDRPEQEWLRDLAEALRRYDIALRLPGEVSPAVLKRERPLLVGREREQQALREQLDRLLAGRGGTVLVGGEAGIGKTTLVEDLSVQAEEVGALVLWGHAYDLSVTPPYGPWLELFQRYRGAAGDLPPLPAFVGSAEELARIGSQESLFAATRDFLVAVAARRPLLLVLDDLHWADQASLDFFRFLARQLADRPILLVATYRSDELTRRHPLYTLLPLLVREAGALRLPVQALDDVGHRALIQSRYQLAEADQARLEQYLAEHAEGNPLFAVELLKTLEADGVLAQDDTGWLLGDLERVAVPLLLMQVIEGRLARLSEETRHLLQIAAVIGQDVPLGLWQEVSGATDDVLVTAIEEGRAAQLIVEVDGGSSFQFRHALLREALYQEEVALRRRVWHRKVAEALTATRSPDPDAVAHHFQQAGDSRAVEWLLKAGERASLAYSWATAVERLEAALALMTEQEAPAVDRGLVVLRIAVLNRYLDPHRTVRLMREARRLAEEAGQPAFAAYCRVLGGLYQCFVGEIRAGLATMEEGATAWERLTDAEREFMATTFQVREYAGSPGFMFGDVVLWLANAGRLREAAALGEERIAGAPTPEVRVGQSGSLYADGWHGLALAYALLGKPQMAREALTRAQTVYQAIEHHTLVAAMYLLQLDHLELPYFADQDADQFRLIAAKGMAAVRKASGANAAGLPVEVAALPLLQLQGEWDRALAVATNVYENAGSVNQSLAIETVAQLAWAQGDEARATRVISPVFPAGPSTEPGNTILSVALPLQRLAVQLALDAHDLPTAHAWLEAHDRWLDWSGAVLGRAEGALLWAQYHHASGDTASARGLAERALFHASEPRQPLALLAVHRFLGRLDTEAHQFEAAEEHLQQSLTLAERCAAPFERALTLLELAELRTAQGKTEEARTLLAEARVLCEPLGAKPTLARVEALERRLAGS